MPAVSAMVSNNAPKSIDRYLSGSFWSIAAPMWICTVSRVEEAVADKRLEVCLSGFEKDPIALYAVYSSTRHLSANIRVFIDFLVEKFGANPFWDEAIGLKRHMP